MSKVGRWGLSLLLTALVVGACGFREDLPTLVPAQPSLTPTLSPEQAFNLTAVAAYPPPPPITPGPTLPVIPYPVLPTPTFGPSPTPIPPTAIAPTYPPPPTFLPTIPPNWLLKLLDSITIEVVNESSSHKTSRVSGWVYDFRPTGYCDGAYRWLTDSHILLFPITGQEEGLGTTQHTYPVVMDVSRKATWFPPINDGTSGGCDQVLWSESLQRLVATTTDEVLVFDATGSLLWRYAGGLPKYELSRLSPSGKHLLTGTTWRNLEDGQTVVMNNPDNITLAWPTWSSDEKRIFGCCFGYIDVVSASASRVQFGLDLPGRDGPGPGALGLYGWWVMNDTRVIPGIDLYISDPSSAGGYRPIMPLVDPVSQTYEDIGARAGIEPNLYCVVQSVSPNREWITAGCTKNRDFNPVLFYLLNVQSFEKYELPIRTFIHTWSSDSQYILLVNDPRFGDQASHYSVWSLVSKDIVWSGATKTSGYSVIRPMWSPTNARLVSVSEDGRGIAIRSIESSSLVTMPSEVISVSWNRQGTALAVLATDGSVWWVPDPSVDHVEQLTPPLPEVRDVKWSPSGTHLAFVSGKDIFVVEVAPP